MPATKKAATSRKRPAAKPTTARSGAKKARAKAPPAKHPGGRPTKFRPEFIEQARRLAELGATDIEVADFFKVEARTLYRWKAENAEFCQSLKAGKNEADDRVERSLFARATGYEHDEVDIRVVDHRIVKTKLRKFYPPDTVAAIFWLKNRRKEDWRDKVEHEHGGIGGGPISISHVSDMTDEQIRARLAELQRAAGGSRSGTAEAGTGPA